MSKFLGHILLTTYILYDTFNTEEHSIVKILTNFGHPLEKLI